MQNYHKPEPITSSRVQSLLSQPHQLARIATERVLPAEVASQRSHRSVASVPRDRHLASSLLARFRNQSGSQRMRTIRAGMEADALDGRLHGAAHRNGADTPQGNMTAAQHRVEQRSRSVPAHSQPRSQGAYRASLGVLALGQSDEAPAALLVLLFVLHKDQYPHTEKGDVGEIERDQIGAPQGRSEAKYQQGAIAHLARATRIGRAADAPQFGNAQRGFACGPLAAKALRPFQDLACLLHWSVIAVYPVQICDAVHVAPDARNTQAAIDQPSRIQRYRFLSGWQSLSAGVGAPGAEQFPIAGVRPLRILCARRPHQVGPLFFQTFEFTIEPSEIQVKLLFHSASVANWLGDSRGERLELSALVLIPEAYQTDEDQPRRPVSLRFFYSPESCCAPSAKIVRNGLRHSAGWLNRIVP
jgi:hypothetical protein